MLKSRKTTCRSGTQSNREIRSDLSQNSNLLQISRSDHVYENDFDGKAWQDESEGAVVDRIHALIVLSPALVVPGGSPGFPFHGDEGKVTLAWVPRFTLLLAFDDCLLDLFWRGVFIV